MRVTHVYRDSYPPQYGGIEQHIHTLVHALKRTIRPDVLVSGSRRGFADDDGVPITSVGALGRLQGAPLSPSLPLRMRSHGTDLFHFHSPNPTGELAYLLSGSSAPMVLTYHTDVVRQAAAFRFYRPFFHAFLRRAARIIVATPLHIDCSDTLPQYRHKCAVIPFGIEVDRFRATPEVLARAADIRRQHGDLLLLFVGKFRYYKGLDYLLHAMPAVRRGRLLLVGEGTEEARLRALADELGLGERVVWLPHLSSEELLATLHASAVFVLPSCNKMEMFGLSQLEAQTCGKPVVSTALGTGVEFVNLHEKTGLVVPPRNPEALADAINRLLDEPDLRHELGQTAQARAFAQFSVERMASETLSVYREVLTGRAPATHPGVRSHPAGMASQ